MVFDTDWAYSAPPGEATPAYNPTPALHAPNLIWGPTDATAKLSQLIQSAHRTIDVTSELLGDPYLEGQLIAADHRGVQVHLITPINPIGAPTNAPDIAFLTSEGVNVRVTVDQYPPPGALPYMHAKTMIVDGRTAYLGSIDLETTEATQDRELGIEFRLPSLVRKLNAQFQSDWRMAADTPGVNREFVQRHGEVDRQPAGTVGPPVEPGPDEPLPLRGPAGSNVSFMGRSWNEDSTARQPRTSASIDSTRARGT